MNEQDYSAIYYRRCCAIDGKISEVATCRRNRRLVPLFSSEIDLPDSVVPSQESAQPSPALLDRICYALTARQREVFLTCTETPSYSEAGRRLGISHAAVIDFLKRMSARNDFVRRFRETRQRQRHA